MYHSQQRQWPLSKWARFSALLAVVLVPPRASAQPSWSRLSVIEPRFDHEMVFDAARGRIVLFGGMWGAGSTTWEFDGSQWLRRTPATNPPPRYTPALAYDAARQRVVLFGGDYALNDTWEWDGTTWIARITLHHPPPRAHPGIAYDAVRARVVLFGGLVTKGTVDDTWEWDGTDWTERFPVNRPPAGDWKPVYNTVRQRVTAIVGSNLWEWDGNDWALQTTAGGPAARSGFAVGFDTRRGRLVLFGGMDFARNLFADTWECDGIAWTQRAPVHGPAARWQHAMAFDPVRGQMVMFGGTGSESALSDTWEWDGTDWVERLPTAPGVCCGARLAFDSARRQAVLFGGRPNETGGWALNEVWEWDDARRAWSPRPASPRPPGRAWHSMVFMASRGKVVVFGGSGNTTSVLGDTWEWDGVAWSLRTPALSPPERHSAGAAYDSARNRIVLFGGWSGTRRDDTWEWDGDNWLQRVASISPTPRASHAMAYDEARSRVVLFGGWDDAYHYLSDTWEWDGSRWIARAVVTRPPPRAWHGLAYDRLRGRVVLFGGLDATYRWLLDTWEWDGNSWTEVSTSTRPVLTYPTLAFEPRRGRTLTYGNFETWEYGLPAPAGTATFGAGCAGGAGTPALDVVAGMGPWLGQPFGVALADLPPGRSTLVWLGSSHTNWGAVRLPLDLGFAGLPSCLLLVSPDLHHPVFNLTGRTTLALPLPPDPVLTGAQVFLQGFVLDPSANAFGAVLSNALEARIGRL